jgi:hypothetical protein
MCETDRMGQASRRRAPRCTEARGHRLGVLHQRSLRASVSPEHVAHITWARQVDHAVHADLPTERQTAADGGHLVHLRWGCRGHVELALCLKQRVRARAGTALA